MKLYLFIVLVIISVPTQLSWKLKFETLKALASLNKGNEVVITHSFIIITFLIQQIHSFFFALFTNSREVIKYPYLRFMIR